jgi:hypothetical protein
MTDGLRSVCYNQSLVDWSHASVKNQPIFNYGTLISDLVSHYRGVCAIDYRFTVPVRKLGGEDGWREVKAWGLLSG